MKTMVWKGAIVLLIVLLLIITFGSYVWVLSTVKNSLSYRIVSDPKIRNGNERWKDAEVRLIGNYQCNKYYKNDGHVAETHVPNSIFSTCKIEGICLTTGGKFILFHRADQHAFPELIGRLNSKAMVNAMGLIGGHTGDFNIALDDSDLIIKFNSKGDAERVTKRTIKGNNEVMTSVNFTHDFKVIDSPVYALKRSNTKSRAANFLTNINVIVNLMMNFKPAFGMESLLKGLENHVLFLDEQPTLEEEMQSLKYSIQVAKLVSSNPILQYCKHEDGTYHIQKALCNNDTIVQENEQSIRREIGVTIQTCFSQFYVGQTLDLTKFIFGRESVFVNFRELAYASLNIIPGPTTKNTTIVNTYLANKDLQVLIVKDSQDETIANSGEIEFSLKNRLSQERFMSVCCDGKNVIVKTIDTLDYLSKVAEMIELVANVDVLITDQSNAFLTIFMRDSTTAIISPTCGYQEQNCYKGITTQLYALPNVLVLDMLDLGSVRCQRRTSVTGKRVCDPVSPIDALANTVVGVLKNRYRHLLALDDVLKTKVA